MRVLASTARVTDSRYQKASLISTHRVIQVDR
jgi:hypothetical protein